ncbi:hypothetical protein DWY30_00880 [Streptococcus salivarius]|uniref:hypothetical protein n=1 Tax=Streptococcus salivarius TaxID=1304 RepID=UPI000CE24CA3|nr:hypothetical protein [Streptococcus salivarius]PPA33242.1 hypothetical protein CGZ74_02470 [Streptococcus salivarius]RGR62835.1 hypothetical protein DWY30_00880 [Streptococcus salivarius]
MLTSDGKEQVLIGFLSSIYVWIFSILMTSIFWLFKKYIYPRFQNIKIKKIDIRNVPKRSNGVELPIFQDQGILKNYIENELVIENPKDNLLIHNLVVDNISLSDYFYEDITIQNGFDNLSQDLDFVICNNGNKNSSLRNYQVEIHYLNKENGKDKIIFRSELEIDSLRGGDIKKIFSRKLTDHKIVKLFSNNLPDYKQAIRIELINKLNQDIESEIEISYLSSEKRFVRSLGGVFEPDRTLIPIIELLSPYSRDNFDFSINHHLGKGEDTLRFNILIDAPCSIKYNVKLLSNSKILAESSSNLIKVQFPKYSLTSSYKDELYHYLHDEKLESSDFEEVKLRKPKLLNSIDKIKHEYNLD